MSDLELIDAVAQKTGGDSHEIRRRGLRLARPDCTGSDHDPECLFDLVDLPEAGMVDWDALGFGCREPFNKSTLTARLRNMNKRAETVVAASTTKPHCTHLPDLFCRSCLRHSQGDTGFGSAHRPCRAARASFSASASLLFLSYSL
jgi:hypothetical protein